MGFFDSVKNVGLDLMTGGGYTSGKNIARTNAASAEDLRKQRELLQQMYDPYITAGQGAIGDYSSAISQMSNPQEYYAQLMQGYETSPQTQLALEEGTRTAEQGASASGMLGSGEMLKGLQKYGQQLTGADQQTWLNNMLGISSDYTSGLSDIAGKGEQGISGYGSFSQNISPDIADLMNQSALGENQSSEAMYKAFQDLISGGGYGSGGSIGNSYSQAYNKAGSSALLGLG